MDLIGANSINNTIGGSAGSAGNLISGNAYDGIYLDLARDDTLAFNLVGADAAQNFSNTKMGNADYGIELDDAPTITISRNLVVNNRQSGVTLFDSLTTGDLISNNEIVLNSGDGIVFCACGDGGSAIYGNLIGTNASGTVNLGNKGYGIEIGSANNTVGGTAAGDANVIAFNTKAGVGLENLTTDSRNTISANSIYANQTLGIDLGESGDPLQDIAGGSQFGPNDFQNYPVLVAAAASTENTTITGSLTGVPNQTFTIQFFSNATADKSGYGQGQTYVGSLAVKTNGSGAATFSFVAAGNLGGQMLSATATDPNGNTSEFAKSIKVSTPGNSAVATTTSLAASTATAAAGQAITLAAKVSAADGSVPSGNVVFFVNGQAIGEPVPLEVVNGLDVATFTTSLPTAGTYTLVAQYGGDSTHAESSSNSISEVINRFPSRPLGRPSSPWSGSAIKCVLDDRGPVRPGSRPGACGDDEQLLAHHRGLHGRFGIGSKHLLLKSAIYNAAADTVTLHTSRQLKVGQRYQLTLERRLRKPGKYQRRHARCRVPRWRGK